jgi:hypothetical protein
VIEPRIYRAAFVPALIALVLAMFSLEHRPRPLPQGLAADVLFDGRQAAGTARTVAERFPHRRAGSTGDSGAADFVARSFAFRGFHVQRDRFQAHGKDLVNVIGRRAGRSGEQIVVAASRDALGSPDLAGSAADTAALVELARVFEGRPSQRTLVLASLDGSRLGQAGAQQLATRLGDQPHVAAVLVMSDLGARSGHSPIVAWSDDSSRVGIGLERTAAESVRRELSAHVGGTSPAGQLSRLAFPLGIGEQGVLLDRGFDSLRISGSGELPLQDAGARLDQDRLGGLGRATLRTVSAIDQSGPPDHGPSSYVTVVSQVLPGWVLSLLALTLLLPAVVGSVDAFARARRRRQPVAPWMRSIGVSAGALVAAFILAKLLSLLNATPDPPGAPVAPGELPLDGPALLVMLILAGVVVAGLIAGRSYFGTGSLGLDPNTPSAGCAGPLVLSVAVLLLWLFNPYAALLMVPAVHLWSLAVLLDPVPPRRARAAALVGGLLPVLAVALHYMVSLSMDPIHGLWYLLLLALGGTPGLPTVLIGIAVTAALVSIGRIALRRDEPESEPPDRPSLRAVPTYAGPGSLGGTESALRP